MESKHTKTPWFVSHSKAALSPLSNRIFKSIKTTKGIGGSIVANAFGGQTFSLESKTKESIAEAEANAAYIVKCVNAHNELASALEALISICKHSQDATYFQKEIDNGIKLLNKLNEKPI